MLDIAVLVLCGVCGCVFLINGLLTLRNARKKEMALMDLEDEFVDN